MAISDNNGVLRNQISNHIWITKSDSDGRFVQWKHGPVGGGVAVFSDSMADSFFHAVYNTMLDVANASRAEISNELKKSAPEAADFIDGIDMASFVKRFIEATRQPTQDKE